MMHVYRHYENIRNYVKGTEVADQQWERSNGGVLVAHDISSNIVFALYDDVNKTGYLGNFDLAYKMDVNPTFTDMKTRVAEEPTNFEFSGWLSGATALSIEGRSPDVVIEYNKLAKLGKITVYSALEQAGIIPIQLDWLNADKKLDTVIFDTSTGSINYSVVDLQ